MSIAFVQLPVGEDKKVLIAVDKIVSMTVGTTENETLIDTVHIHPETTIIKVSRNYHEVLDFLTTCGLNSKPVVGGELISLYTMGHK